MVETPAEAYIDHALEAIDETVDDASATGAACTEEGDTTPSGCTRPGGTSRLTSLG